MPFALAVLIAIAYANSLTAGFVLDNRPLILENPHLRGATWANVRTILTHDYWHPFAVNGLYRPLTTLSYLFNYSALGNADRAVGYHVVDLILHWTCSALVYVLMRRVRAVPAAAALAAALFALHPIATEAVTNIVGRADLLAALAVLAGLASHVEARTRHGTARYRWLTLLGCAALLGVFSKENAVVLLPLVIAWEFLIEPAQSWRERRSHLGASVAIIGGVIGAMLMAGAVVRAHELVTQSSALDNPILAARFWAGRATAMAVVGLQIWQLFWPAQLSSDYSYDQIPIVTWPPDGWTVAAWMTAVSVVALAWWLRTRAPAVAFMIVFFLVALLPTSNLLLAVGSIRADRFLYLPLVGFAGAVSGGAYALARTEHRRRIVAGTATLALVLCGWRTIVRNRDWANDETLWRSAVAAAPNSAKAHKGYAVALFARGERDRLDLAISHAARAVAIRPDYIGALLDLGGYYVAKGDRLTAAGDASVAHQAYTNAISLLRRGRKLDRVEQRNERARMIAGGRLRTTIPERGSAGLYRNLTVAYLGLDELERALVSAHYARRLNPWELQTYLDVSGLHARRGKWDSAAATLFEIIALDRSNRDAWIRLAELYRIIEPGNAAVTVDERGANMDERAPLVRRHRCRAHAELARLFARARLAEVERRARDWVADNCLPPARTAAAIHAAGALH